MVRKISFLIFSVAILVMGIIGFSKLGYREKSVRIFKYSSAAFAGRIENGHDRRFEEGEERQNRVRFNRNIPDSIKQKMEPHEQQQMEAGSFRRGIRNGDGNGRGEFPGAKKIRLRNVLWFLSVFALFTVTALYFDKGFSYVRKRRAIAEGRSYDPENENCEEDDILKS